MPSRVSDELPSLVDPRWPASPETAGATLWTGWEHVWSHWRDTSLLSEQSQARLTELGGRFVRRLEQSGLHSWDEVTERACADFITAPTIATGAPSPSTQHLRRSTVRAIFRSLRDLGVVHGDPTLDLKLPPREAGRYRPLTDDEVVLCRVSARLGSGGARSLRRAVAWALGEATAATSEIGVLRVRDIRLAETSTMRTTQVCFPGSRRYAARVAEVSSWGQAVLARRIHTLSDAGLDEDALLAYGGVGDSSAYRAQASVCTQLTRVLDQAGLRDDPAVGARSLRGWAGRHLYDAGAPIEQVAVQLGCRSLDAAAAEIGLTWHP